MPVMQEQLSALSAQGFRPYPTPSDLMARLTKLANTALLGWQCAYRLRCYRPF